MSHDEDVAAGKRKLVYMANQIARFFASMPREEQVQGVARHISDFWEPRMRRHFFEIVEAGGEGLSPLVVGAASHIRRPPPPEPLPAAAQAR